MNQQIQPSLTQVTAQQLPEVIRAIVMLAAMGGIMFFISKFVNKEIKEEEVEGKK